jgi:uncharacterized membrane protein YeaQ/YmgE (transglycosylase-associated protein family)
MPIVWFVVIGCVVGVLAKLVVPGRGAGFFVTVFVAIAGALITTYIGDAIGFFGDPTSTYVGAAVGAIALVVLHRVLVRNDE